jgi:hypothetical protein
MASGLCAAWLACAVPMSVHAQQAPAADVVVDRMLAVVNGDVVTLSDLRVVRVLRLVPLVTSAGTAAPAPAAITAMLALGDDALVTQVIERRLVLAEIARYAPPEPTAEQITARRAAWSASLAPGTDVAQALRHAGLREPALAAWLRDDQRITAYLDQRFTAAAQPTRAQAQAYFRDHSSEFTSSDFTKVEADVRKKLAADRRAQRIREWIDQLVQRAEIRRLQ